MRTRKIALTALLATSLLSGGCGGGVVKEKSLGQHQIACIDNTKAGDFSAAIGRYHQKLSGLSLAIAKPANAADGNFALFEIYLLDPLAPGDTLKLYVDDYYERAFTLRTSGELGVKLFSGRVRSRDGLLRAELRRADGSRESSEASFPLKSKGSAPPFGNTNLMAKCYIRGNEMTVGFGNNMGLDYYMEHAAWHTPKGDVELDLTTRVAGYKDKDNPGYLKVGLDQPVGKADFAMELN